MLVQFILVCSLLAWACIALSTIFVWVAGKVPISLGLFIFGIYAYPLAAVHAFVAVHRCRNKNLPIKPARILRVPLAYVLGISALGFAANTIEDAYFGPNVRYRASGLTAFPMQVLKHAVPVENLDLSGNRLTTLPPEMSQLAELRYLNLSNNRFDSLPAVVCSLRKLVYLDLSGNPIEALPPEIGQLTALGTLVMKNSKLRSVPEDLANLRALWWLDLSGSPFANVPPPIAKLPALTILELRHCQNLTHLPAEFRSLTNLEKLSMEGSGVIALPPELSTLPKIKRVALKDVLLERSVSGKLEPTRPD